MNPVLNELFADLYELILGRFEQVFGCPFCFHGGLALPGFHIFGPRPGRSPSILNPAFLIVVERFIIIPCRALSLS